MSTARPPATAFVHTSRRAFIRASLLTGGGCLLGVPLITGTANAGHTDETSHVHALNAYIRIPSIGSIVLVMPKVDMGQGTHTALSMLIAEELEIALQDIRLESAPAAPAIYGFEGDQSTGGSTSVMQCWEPLRTAGATARTMLIAAGARHWHVPVDTCHASAGDVVHAPSNRRLSYQTLATAAAREPVPTNVALKKSSQWTLIGRTQPKLDTPAKTNGSAVFGIDIKLPHLHYAVLARAPVQGSTVRTINSAEALRIHGVRHIVNEGEFVAVIADHTWAAMLGLRALAPTWNLSHNAHVQQADLVESLATASLQPGVIASTRGDPGATLATSTHVYSALYQQPLLAHAALEPMNATVHWHDGLCEVWAGTQAIDRAQAKLVLLGLKPEQITIHNQLIGGGFGRRLEVDGIEYAARIARHVPYPVHVLWTRSEDLQQDRYRPLYADRLQASLDAAGLPNAWTHTVAGSAVSQVWDGNPLKNGIDDDAVQSSANLPYQIRNLAVRFVQHEPIGVTTSWWRGVGPTRGVFVVESFIDELAHAARQDPIRYRRALISAPRLLAVLDRVAHESHWNEPLPAGHGRGVSIQAEFGSFMAQVADVSVSGSEVRVERITCVLDCGQVVNPDTVHAQMEGGIVFGLSAILKGEITIKDGRVEQSNFNDYPVLRFSESPRIDTYLMTSDEPPGGVGEAGTACVGAALCNAIYVASGKRIRTLPVVRGLAS